MSRNTAMLRLFRGRGVFIKSTFISCMPFHNRIKKELKEFVSDLQRLKASILELYAADL